MLGKLIFEDYSIISCEFEMSINYIHDFCYEMTLNVNLPSEEYYNQLLKKII